MKPVSSDPSSQQHVAAGRHARADDDRLASDAPRAWLSALADGDAQAAGEGCRLWRDDEDARQAWHTYHLIGDAMRSDELCARPSHDAAFLAGVRARLAAEPVVLAPSPAVAGSSVRRRQPWLMPVAAAAGVAVVAGVLVVARIGAPGSAGDALVADRGLQLISAQPVSTQARPAAAVAKANGAQVYLRDARLDEYLRVHNVSRGGVAVAAPGAGLQPIPVAAPVVSSNPGR